MNRLRAVLLVLALGLTACGGDDGGGSATGSAAGGALSKSEYVKQAKAVQDRVEDETTKLGASEPKSVDDIGGIFEMLQKQVKRAQTDLGKLTPPEDAAEAHAKALEATNLLISDLDGIVAAANAGDTEKLQQLVVGGFPSKKAKAASEEASKLYKDSGYEALAED